MFTPSKRQAGNHMKVLGIIIIMLVGASLSARAQEPVGSGEVLTLDQAISLALRDNDQVKIAALGVGKSENELAATRTSRLPSIHVFSLSYEQLIKPNFILPSNPQLDVLPGVDPFFFLSVARTPKEVFGGLVIEPLSPQYRIGLQIQATKLAGQQDRENLRLAQHSAIDGVKQAYYGILQTQSALESIQEAIRLYRELDRVTAQNVAQQVSLRADSLQVQTRLARADYEALDLTDRLSTQKEQLNNLLGRDVRMEFTVSPVPDTTEFEFDLTAARSRALNQRPELSEARLRIKQAEVDRRIKKSEYIPDVSAGFSYLSSHGFSDILPPNLATVGVVVRWEVFDWGRKRDQLAEKDKTIEQTKTALHDAESQVLIDVGDKFRKLRESRQALVVARLEQDTARETVRINTNKYRVTAALLSDVLQAQASLAEADHSYQQALLGFWTARAEFEKAIGEDK
jgi:outer membrane protein